MYDTTTSQSENTLIKPFLKWAGDNRQLLPEILKSLPENFEELRYIEPFIGAGSLFLALQPRQAIINDTNEQLMLTNEAIRDHLEELIVLLNSHKEQDSEEYYYQIRAQDRNLEAFKALSCPEKAARLIYLNKTCFHGIYRISKKGFFNAPYGRNTNSDICDEPVLRAIHDYFGHQNTSIKTLNINPSVNSRNFHD
jgi:DNA adenine methylase